MTRRCAPRSGAEPNDSRRGWIDRNEKTRCCSTATDVNVWQSSSSGQDVYRRVGDVSLMNENCIGGRDVHFLAWKVGLLKLPLGGVIWVYRDLVDKEGYTIPGLPSSFKNTTGMAKGSAICAIGMVKVPFVINLKFSRAVECKNILKLPRPTLLCRLV